MSRLEIALLKYANERLYGIKTAPTPDLQASVSTTNFLGKFAGLGWEYTALLPLRFGMRIQHLGHNEMPLSWEVSKWFAYCTVVSHKTAIIAC